MLRHRRPEAMQSSEFLASLLISVLVDGEVPGSKTSFARSALVDNALASANDLTIAEVGKSPPARTI